MAIFAGFAGLLMVLLDVLFVSKSPSPLARESKVDPTRRARVEVNTTKVRSKSLCAKRDEVSSQLSPRKTCHFVRERARRVATDPTMTT